MSAVPITWHWRVALALYRLAGPLLLLVSLLPWLRKTSARGGWGTPLGERFGCYREDREWEPCGGTHVHAVSVGETLIALKFLKQWRYNSNEKIVLSVGTATAWEIATKAALDGVRVCYAPIDFLPFVRSYLRRFSPSRIILVEAEAWPELIEQCRQKNIPVAMVNARLSARSERRFCKLLPFVRPLFASLTKVGVQEAEDIERFAALGVCRDAIVHTGSVKFDPGMQNTGAVNEPFRDLLRERSASHPVVLAASTHAGEEVWIGRAVREAGAFYVCVPRHAERRDAVCEALVADGWKVEQRTSGRTFGEGTACYLVDTTGELQDWTTLADVVVIGKSFLAHGGQNPCEAIMAGRCVVVGPNMENFEPLNTRLVNAGGVMQVRDQRELADFVSKAVRDSSMREEMAKKALEILNEHKGAVERTLRMMRAV